MSASHSRRGHSLLRQLNLFGLGHLDLVILAALADERPLLLIGPPGTAKSELLNRIAAALSLEHRHYNASLISVDDLLGYPVPNEARDGIRYLVTPGDLWQAESVFLDEISRCRPENQNKLFSIIHERRVQGLPLTRLRYRWAAMNPPPDEEGEYTGDVQCFGSLPLDPALADRFPWVVVLHGIESLSSRERRALLREGNRPPQGNGGLPQRLEAAREALDTVSADVWEWAVCWVDALLIPLREARLPLSGRRAVALVQSVCSLWAAARALARDERLEDLAFVALKWGLPQRAQGREIDDTLLLPIHRAAVADADQQGDGPWHQLRRESDPVRRLALALGFDGEEVGTLELSQLAQDAMASLSLPQRYALSWAIAPVLSECPRFIAPACELLATPMNKILRFTLEGERRIAVHRSRAGEWNEILEVVSALEKNGDPHAGEFANLLYTLFSAEEERFEPGRVVEEARQWRTLFLDTLGHAGPARERA